MRLRRLPFVLAFVIASPVAAQTPRDVSDLVGARGSSGEGELQRRGYQFIRVQTGDDRKWTFWWSADRHQCISVATVNGRYDSLTRTPAADCGRRDDPEAGARGDGYHPDLGFSRGAGRVVSPSYAEAVPPEGQSDDRLSLVCIGDGQRPGLTSSSGETWDDRRKRYNYETRPEVTPERFDASLTVQVWPGGGRVRLPAKLVPPLHSGGEDGWWPLYDVSLGRDAITASYRLNALNKPRMTIDRRMGRVTVEGASDYGFRGNCEPAGSEARRF